MIRLTSDGRKRLMSNTPLACREAYRQAGRPPLARGAAIDMVGARSRHTHAGGGAISVASIGS